MQRSIHDRPVRASHPRHPVRAEELQWLDLGAAANVTVQSAGRRVPCVLCAWCADGPGERTIEIQFHKPTSLRRLRVVSAEAEQLRTQEITVWASQHRGERHREVLRRRFSFSPSGATREVEEHALHLDDVSMVQVRIVPSIDGRPALARVSELRLASTQAPARK